MNLAKINPLNLPSLPLNERSHLPKCSAIYFVMQGEDVLYIGKTTNLAQRLTAHNRQKQFTKLSSDICIAWLECNDTKLLKQIEEALIDLFKPLLNGTTNPDASKRVNLTLPHIVYEDLEAWAEYQGRPTANLAAYLVESAIREAKEKGEFRILEKSNKETQNETSSSSKDKKDK
ncbi:MAG: ribbon-helix-helix domain-containing protein [Nostoc sp.]